MHADEVDTAVSLVRRLRAAQFPRWADLPIARVASAGTDNAIYRLGRDMAVRLPRIAWAVGQVEKEHRWLPMLAPHLPLTIPVPLAMGAPAEGYPWQWGIYPWIEGENATPERLADLDEAAQEMAHFITRLQRIDATGGPPPGPQNSSRGAPLAQRDPYARESIAALRAMQQLSAQDADAVTALWDAALNAAVWDGPPTWLHGDLQPGNLLAVQGRLSAVIDFGCLGVGDPACDLIAAWHLFTGESRAVFHAALAVDNAMWMRGRGWALSVALIALPYYLDTNPTIVANSRHVIREVLADARANHLI
jgi:aminoglycoside phosphotransferase (APT) family kinase protein